jgi:ATP-dependent DNA helicase RecG
VGPQRADLLKKELGIYTFRDLLELFPYRHIDKTQVTPIQGISEGSEYVLVKGKLVQFDIVGEKRGRRLVASLQDHTGELELVWFQGVNWIEKTLSVGSQYLVFGKVSFFLNQTQITHP